MYVGATVRVDDSWWYMPTDNANALPSDIQVGGTLYTSNPIPVTYVGPMFDLAYRCYVVRIAYGVIGGSSVIYRDYYVSVGPI